MRGLRPSNLKCVSAVIRYKIVVNIFHYSRSRGGLWKGRRGDAFNSYATASSLKAGVRREDEVMGSEGKWREGEEESRSCGEGGGGLKDKRGKGNRYMERWL